MQKAKILVVIAACAALVEINAAAAADPTPAAASPSSASPTEELQEVTVTAAHQKLNWAQRNELVQEAATYVYGVVPLENYDQLARWSVPVCPLVAGLNPDHAEFVVGRISEIVRASKARMAGERCHPNLMIWVTANPRELLRAMENRRYAVSFGNVPPSQIDQFIRRPGPIWIWHNTYQAATHTYVFGPVYVVVDQARMQGVTQGQFADYVAMASLVDVRPTAHVGNAQSILRLFDGVSKSAPAGLSDWDQSFLKMVYTPEWSLATERSLIARRMVNELVP